MNLHERAVDAAIEGAGTSTHHPDNRRENPP
jgi:hypothetical protein